MNLVDIPVIVSTLVTFFATGGADASVEFIKGITVNGSTKLVELKDELIVQPAVNKALEAYKADLSDTEAKQALEQKLTNALESHPVFNNSGVHIEGDSNAKVSAKKGSFSAVNNTGDINITNTFKWQIRNQTSKPQKVVRR